MQKEQMITIEKKDLVAKVAELRKQDNRLVQICCTTLADGFGFESLFMHSWRVRETLLDIVEETTGGRVIFGIAKVGGVRRDMNAAKLKEIKTRLQALEIECRKITDVFVKDGSVKRRLCGIGVLSRETAYALGAVGRLCAQVACPQIPDSLGMGLTAGCSSSRLSKPPGIPTRERWCASGRSISPSI